MSNQSGRVFNNLNDHRKFNPFAKNIRSSLMKSRFAISSQSPKLSPSLNNSVCNNDNENILTFCPSLDGVSLNLSNNNLTHDKLTDDVLSQQCRMQGLMNLFMIQSLILRENRLSFDHDKNQSLFIVVMKFCPHLSHLDLSCNDFRGTFPVISIDKRHQGVKTLKYLDLSRNQLIDISNLVIFEALEYLNVSHNQINAIMTLGMCQLNVLDISNNALRNEVDLRLISMSTTIRSLNIDGNPLMNTFRTTRRSPETLNDTETVGSHIRAMVCSMLPHLEILNGMPLPIRTRTRTRRHLSPDQQIRSRSLQDLSYDTVYSSDDVNIPVSMNNNRHSISKDEQYRKDNERMCNGPQWRKSSPIKTTEDKTNARTKKITRNELESLIHRLSSKASLNNKESTSKSSSGVLVQKPMKFTSKPVEKPCERQSKISFARKYKVNQTGKQNKSTNHKRNQLNESTRKEYPSTTQDSSQSEQSSISKLRAEESVAIEEEKETIFTVRDENPDIIDVNHDMAYVMQLFKIVVQIISLDHKFNSSNAEGSDGEKSIDDRRLSMDLSSSLNEFTNIKGKIRFLIDNNDSVTDSNPRSVHMSSELSQQTIEDLTEIIQGMSICLSPFYTLNLDQHASSSSHIPNFLFKSLKSKLMILMMTNAGKAVYESLLLTAGFDLYGILNIPLRTTRLRRDTAHIHTQDSSASCSAHESKFERNIEVESMEERSVDYVAITKQRLFRRIIENIGKGTENSLEGVSDEYHLHEPSISASTSIPIRETDASIGHKQSESNDNLKILSQTPKSLSVNTHSNESIPSESMCEPRDGNGKEESNSSKDPVQSYLQKRKDPNSPEASPKRLKSTEHRCGRTFTFSSENIVVDSMMR